VFRITVIFHVDACQYGAKRWTIRFMNPDHANRLIRNSQAIALVGLPLVWMLMFALHFRSIADFFVFRDHYVPVPAAETVTRLIEAKNRWPMIHDPHQLGYLSLPLFVLGAFGLYAVGRGVKPWVAALGISLSVTGSIYLGGVFGLFTALYRGIGDVDAQYADGAIATFAAVTANHGAYGLTRRLAELAIFGLAVQAIALWRAPRIPRWAPVMVVAGCLLFLAFWDVDNMMFAASMLLIAGFLPVARELRRPPDTA
jgi:hypothetical protein